MPHHDVVIVGAGPVGLMLACLLAQREVDVLVCERRPDADTRSRAIGIHRPGLDALDAAGIGAAVRGEALALEGGEVRSRGRMLAELDFAPERPVLVLPQRRTDDLLRHRLGVLARGALRQGHVVRSVRDEEEFVRVAVDAGHGLREITGSFAVIADGVHSGIREQLGIDWREHPGAGRYSMIDVPDDAGRARAVLHCEPAGLVESFPMPGARRRWVVRHDGARPLDTATALRSEIERRTGIRPAIPDDLVPVVFDVTQHAAAAFADGRIVLLGDAAHEVSPIGGQGMNLGWADAVRLAAGIIRGLERGQPDFRSYARRSARAARRAQRRAAFYMSMGATAAGAPLVMREQVIRVLGSRPLRGWACGLITMRGV